MTYVIEHVSAGNRYDKVHLVVSESGSGFTGSLCGRASNSEGPNIYYALSLYYAIKLEHPGMPPHGGLCLVCEEIANDPMFRLAHLNI